MGLRYGQKGIKYIQTKDNQFHHGEKPVSLSHQISSRYWLLCSDTVQKSRNTWLNSQGRHFDKVNIRELHFLSFLEDLWDDTQWQIDHLHRCSNKGVTYTHFVSTLFTPSEQTLHLICCTWLSLLVKAMRCSWKLVCGPFVRIVLSKYVDCADVLDLRIWYKHLIVNLSRDLCDELKSCFLKHLKAMMHYPAESISL